MDSTETSQYEAQVEEFIRSMGRFVLEFERVCDGMRSVVTFMLQTEGLENQGIIQVLVGEKSSAELQQLLGAAFCELRDHDDDDRKAVRDLLARVKKLTEERNTLLHSRWNLGSEPSETELYAATVRYRSRQNQGSRPVIHGVSASYVNELSDEAIYLQVLLRRLVVCVCQSGYKVADDFSKKV